jgi:3-isopropylmalate/(R)-2-methylmalate dehydratase small subunit
VDLERCTLTLPEGNSVSFAVPAFARHCLLHGIDEMQFLLEMSADTATHEARYPTSIDTRTAGAVA